MVAAFDAAVKPLAQYVTEITKSCIIWLFPSRENDTILEIEARHLQDNICSDEESLRRWEEQNKRIKRESEASEMRRKGEDDKEQLGQLQETIRAIDVQRANLALERRRRADAKKEGKIVVADKAREAEDPRPTREPREPRGRKPIQEPRKWRPVNEARQAEKTKGIEIARQIKEEMLFEEVQEATKRGLVEEARGVGETGGIGMVRLAGGEVLVEDAQQAEEGGLAEEARQAEESRRIEDERIRVADEISMVKKRVKRVRETGRERRGVGQTVNEPRKGIQPTVWPSKEELQLAKEKTQYSPVHFGFAVTGASGSGKSSLINIFLDLPDNHENGARTDVIETTSVLTRYPDPGDQPPRKWTVWYDVPGAGTSAIPAWQYFNQQYLFVFDLILVVFDNRITEIDLDILRNCRKFNIPSFIIRSKADVHIKNRMKSSGYESGDDVGDPDLRRKCRDHFITNTRQSVERELEKAALPPQKVYIVSCSKQFRREYSAFTSGLDQSTDGSGRERFVDEMELIHDLMLAAASRRCDIKPKVFRKVASIWAVLTNQVC